MSEQEIIEGNKLIAEFMGAISYKHGIYDGVNFPEKTEEGFKSYDLIYLEYHSSWGWLMPVVEKIEKLTVKWKISQFKKDGWTKQNKTSHWYEVHIEGNTCDVYEGLAMVNVHKIILPHNDPYFKWINTSKLYAVWLCCVEFIKWYNENNC